MDGTVLLESLSDFTVKLHAWNMDGFGSVFRRKRRTQKRLEGVMKVMDEKPMEGLKRLVRNLKKEWSEILLQEEML